ncbi:hypothetical protein PANT_16d00083 [Moesziomyces antarcticus T-34]|uniref:Uncharacterized protein n=1 Tax=Pseudozyma antarctica (strain T-34) TaxID=1151754 RepID=M9M574_PSEA3|nr:hypothetical protein PANT_16d00083 [Moesziomyces antarcticus T-34]
MTDGTHPPARSEDFSAGHGSGIHIHACQYCKPLIPTIRTGPRRHDPNANNVPSRQLAFSHTHSNSRPSARARMLPLLNASSLGPPAIAARSFHHMSGPVCRSIHATPLAFASVVPPIGQSCPTASSHAGS